MSGSLRSGDLSQKIALAHQLREQGRLDAATATMLTLGRQHAGELEMIFDCAQFIKQCHRHAEAAELCERQIASGPTHPKLYALAGSIAHELGRFAQARAYYLAALAGKVNLNEWFVLQALSNTQRYTDAQHPDFALFATGAQDPALTPRARASTLFALAKACDDIADHARAAQVLREANALARNTQPWSRDVWRRFVSAQLSAPSPRVAVAAEADAIPIFIVGMVRSGTTLVAEHLGRHPQVRNRGELPFMAYLSEQLISQGLAADPAALAEARRIYLAHLRQDDAPARWYVDKHPLNFRYLGLIAALFPQARVIHCRRDRRDNALSIWSQLFAHRDNDYAYDFDDIAAFGDGCDALMAHWKRTLALPIHTLHYEQMVAQPEQTLAQLQAFVGLPIVSDVGAANSYTDSVIASASMWQARQPIYHRSVGRWRSYAPFVPELVEAAADTDG